jgi:hypothetical protein
MHLLLWHFYFNFIHCGLKNNWSLFLECNVYNVYIIYRIVFRQLFPVSLESFFYMIDTNLASTISYISFMIDSHLAFILLN